MTKQDYPRPASLEEALAARASRPEAAFLAGGTYLLSGGRGASASGGRDYIDVSRLLPRGLERRGAELVVGAGATFQDILDSAAAPASLKAAAASMASRNIRNRATVGGNLGAGKSCASLIPLLLVLDARVEAAKGPGADRVSLPLAAWLERPEGLLLDVIVPLERGRRRSFQRWGRSACDVSVLTAAASYGLEADGAVRGLAVAAGGLGPRARRFPEIERLFEGKKLPTPTEMEEAIRPLLSPIDDLRGSASFKRLRGAVLIADAVAKAEAEA